MIVDVRIVMQMALIIDKYDISSPKIIEVVHLWLPNIKSSLPELNTHENIACWTFMAYHFGLAEAFKDVTAVSLRQGHNLEKECNGLPYIPRGVIGKDCFHIVSGATSIAD